MAQRQAALPPAHLDRVVAPPLHDVPLLFRRQAAELASLIYLPRVGSLCRCGRVGRPLAPQRVQQRVRRVLALHEDQRPEPPLQRPSPPSRNLRCALGRLGRLGFLGLLGWCILGRGEPPQQRDKRGARRRDHDVAYIWGHVAAAPRGPGLEAWLEDAPLLGRDARAVEAVLHHVLRHDCGHEPDAAAGPDGAPPLSLRWRRAGRRRQRRRVGLVELALGEAPGASALRLPSEAVRVRAAGEDLGEALPAKRLGERVDLVDHKHARPLVAHQRQRTRGEQGSQRLWRAHHNVRRVVLYLAEHHLGRPPHVRLHNSGVPFLVRLALFRQLVQHMQRLQAQLARRCDDDGLHTRLVMLDSCQQRQGIRERLATARVPADDRVARRRLLACHPGHQASEHRLLHRARRRLDSSDLEPREHVRRHPQLFPRSFPTRLSSTAQTSCRAPHERRRRQSRQLDARGKGIISGG
eukprot:scaffold93649_cov69-Phaeocystis_antarctica.AAC.2